jgi:hypothetical protein
VCVFWACGVCASECVRVRAQARVCPAILCDGRAGERGCVGARAPKAQACGAEHPKKKARAFCVKKRLQDAHSPGLSHFSSDCRRTRDPFWLLRTHPQQTPGSASAPWTAPDPSAPCPSPPLPPITCQDDLGPGQVQEPDRRGHLLRQPVERRLGGRAAAQREGAVGGPGAPCYGSSSYGAAPA